MGEVPESRNHSVADCAGARRRCCFRMSEVLKLVRPMAIAPTQGLST